MNTSLILMCTLGVVVPTALISYQMGVVRGEKTGRDAGHDAGYDEGFLEGYREASGYSTADDEGYKGLGV